MAAAEVHGHGRLTEDGGRPERRAVAARPAGRGRQQEEQVGP